MGGTGYSISAGSYEVDKLAKKGASLFARNSQTIRRDKKKVRAQRGSKLSTYGAIFSGSLIMVERLKVEGLIR
jgi:hypothetical protein